MKIPNLRDSQAAKVKGEVTFECYHLRQYGSCVFGA